MRTEAPSDTRLNRLLSAACAVLVVIDLLHIPLGLASIPRFYERVVTLTIPVYGSGGGNALTNEVALAEAAARGMSMPTYALYKLGIQLVASLVCTTVAGLVWSRARTHWFGWFTAHVLLFLNSYAYFPVEQVALLVPPVWLEWGSIFWPTFGLYFFLFPNGRAVPRWARAPILIYALTHFAIQLAGVLAQTSLLPSEWFRAILGPAEVFILGALVFILGCQVYRYVRVSSVVEREQTKWFLLGLVVLIVPSSIAVPLGAGTVFRTFEWGTLSLSLVPLTLAIAILRYRLWDIDLIIRRTLIYSILTAALGLIYFGLVVFLQSLLSRFGNQQSPIIIVLSTLAIAALFTPLRRGLQNFIDRRFYRKKYDAAKTLAEFAATARDEVDVERLTGRLVAVVEETMQPERVGLWLRTPQPRGAGKKSRA